MKLTRVTKHHTLIIFLHWSMAITLLLMLLTGEFMEDSLSSPIFVLHAPNQLSYGPMGRQSISGDWVHLKYSTQSVLTNTDGLFKGLKRPNVPE